MFRRLLLAPTIVLLVSLQLLSPPTGAAAGRTVNATFTSPNFGYALSYDDPWSVVEDGSARGEELLVLTDGVANVLVAATDIFGDDAEACVPATAEQFTSDPAISDVQAAVDADGAEISGADEFGAYGLYQYLFDSPDAPVSEYTLAVQCFHLTPDALLIVLFDVQTAAFEDELPLFLTLLEGLTLPTTEAAEPRAEPPAKATKPTQSSRSKSAASKSDLETYVDVLVDDLDELWAATFDSVGERYASPEVVIFDRTVRTACGSAVPGEVGPFYCPADATIYLDAPFLELLTENFGPGAVANAVAHEWGHHIQQLLGINTTSVARSLNGSSSLETELQADCLAGAWTQSAEAGGLLTTTDVDAAIVVLTLIGDSPEAGATGSAFFDQQHGSGSLRAWWFLQGYFEGVATCLE